MSTLPPQLRIVTTAALDGPYGTLTQHAKRSGVSLQALYRDVPKVLQAVDGSDAQRRFQDLQDEIDRLCVERTTLRRPLQQAVLVDADALAPFASIAQAEGVRLPVAGRASSLCSWPNRSPRNPTGFVCPVLLDSFDELAEVDKHQILVEILRRFPSTDTRDLSEAALIEMANDLFRALDAEEACHAPR